MTATEYELPSTIDEECAFALADAVLAAAEPIGCAIHRILLVPDLVLLQGIANGEDVGNPWRLRRADGREVAIYATPEGWHR